ncbi:site-specific integrase [Pantoea sp. BAV 3049]|uniref:tyrosine-type recombinase/integrase n=1 Tax=Pantoea sp. BAV 3049 TaxID=2654188 RepID=UPI00131B7E39|nr:site-specific integrase [Pantoea sp. BAV 3049]
MALSDSYLRSVLGKDADKVFEKTDRDGLSVRVSRKGKVTFQLRYMFGGKQRRTDVGGYPGISLKDARDEAVVLRRALENGIDPAQFIATRVSKNVNSATVQKVIEEWGRVYAQPNIKKSEQILRSFELHVYPKIGNLKHDAVTTHQWLEIIEGIQKTAPSIARRILTNAKQAHSWSVRRKLTEEAPLSSITAHDIGLKRNVTKRVLSDNEICLLFEALDNTAMLRKNVIFILLVMLYGCRSGELLSAEKTHFDFSNDTWVVPPENHKGGKSGRSITRPVIPAAKLLIEEAILLNPNSKYLFGSWHRDKSVQEAPVASHSVLSLPKTIISYVIREKSEIMQHWSLHDLRRTARTRWASFAPPHVCEIMLGHALPGIWAVYDHNDYLDEQRKAYTTWWATVMRIVHGENGVSSIVTL